ncbi:MAG: hypothetical protein M3O26_15725 [Pseudomonadota bacterium]|nr:hypothetical protein [Pseudomonadota bacterium]
MKFADMPWSSALLFSFAIVVAICVLIVAVDAWLANREKRQIRRAKRKRSRQTKALRKAHILIKNAELAKRREDVNVRVSRGFIRAFRGVRE